MAEKWQGYSSAVGISNTRAEKWQKSCTFGLAWLWIGTRGAQTRRPRRAHSVQALLDTVRTLAIQHSIARVVGWVEQGGVGRGRAAQVPNEPGKHWQVYRL